MTGKCGNQTWKSLIRPRPQDPQIDDGEIDTDTAESSGAFTGHHRRNLHPRQPITGHCMETPDRMIISRLDGSQHHLYFGWITVEGPTTWVRGYHRVTVVPVDAFSETLPKEGRELSGVAPPDDEWVGSHAT